MPSPALPGISWFKTTRDANVIHAERHAMGAGESIVTVITDDTLLLLHEADSEIDV
jgi:hypothetical protein